MHLVEAPWSPFAGLPGVPLSRLDGRELRWPLIPRLLGQLPPERHSVLWNARSPALAAWGAGAIPPSWDLALGEHGAEQRFASPSGGQGCVRLGLLAPRAVGEEREEDPRERWLYWQYERYHELARPEQLQAPLESEIPGGVRRSWVSVVKTWTEREEGDAALALIVELAQRSSLVHALESIVLSPRRMLRRIHRLQRLSRVRELDPVSLRHLIRRPGRTVAERAGPRQQILAGLREETADIPENRVLLWTVRRMERMGIAWCKRNEPYRHSRRYQAVRRLIQLVRRVREQQEMMGVAPLQHHMIVPTYCFQFESRYRQVWRAYGEIRREEQALDDLWRWQSHLWSGTAGLLLDSLTGTLPGWEEHRASTPYFRPEGTRGEWVIGPSTPGPWRTPAGDCHVFDLRDELSEPLLCEGFGAPPQVAASGADRVLVLDRPGVIVLAWSCLPATRETGFPLPGLRELDGKLDELGAETHWDLRALILAAEPESTGADSEWVEEHGRVRVLRIPRDVSIHWGDLRAGLELLLEPAVA